MSPSSRWSLHRALAIALLLTPVFACDPTPPVPPEATDAATLPSDATTDTPDAARAGPDAQGAPPDAQAAGLDAAPAPGDDAALPLPDAGNEPPDAAAPPDTGVAVPLPGFGTLTGECGVLDTELTDADPHFVLNTLDFGTDQYDPADLSKLTPDGQRVMTTPNAGGASVVSEAFAVEVLVRCELARLLKTEMEVTYFNSNGSRTDELVALDGLKIGVSVVRATDYPYNPFTEAEATRVLEKKLQGVLNSTANVSLEDEWIKQILFVLANTQQHADLVRLAWEKAPVELRADTVVVVTVTEGADWPIYNN